MIACRKSKGFFLKFTIRKLNYSSVLIYAGLIRKSPLQNNFLMYTACHRKVCSTSFAFFVAVGKGAVF